MKPDWKDAPMDARWLAQDSDGSWEWHGTKPIKNKTSRCSMSSPYKGYWDHKKPTKLWETAGQGEPNSQWQTTLEPRP